ncbi:uncharacterized protein BDV17DRAFT_288681 [Aspergillus undulatus]|uniref:uncharacterized protein n=1 Tax=Aspergillus undulatus TaxID=1810928 RepID=UPI003CCD19A3
MGANAVDGTESSAEKDTIRQIEGALRASEQRNGKRNRGCGWDVSAISKFLGRIRTRQGQLRKALHRHRDSCAELKELENDEAYQLEHNPDDDSELLADSTDKIFEKLLRKRMDESRQEIMRPLAELRDLERGMEATRGVQNIKLGPKQQGEGESVWQDILAKCNDRFTEALSH